MKKMKIFILVNIIVISICLILFGSYNYFYSKKNIDDKINKENNDTKILSVNNYSKNIDYEFVQITDNVTVKSYQDILNIIYTTLDHGITELAFYCDDNYTNCYNDVKKIMANKNLLSAINSFVHPFNEYKKIGITNNSDGTNNIFITKMYSDTDIDYINKKTNEIISDNILDDMTSEEKIHIIHDYIINNTKFSYSKDDENYTALGALLNGKCTDGGYSDLFSIIMSKLNIENFKVASDLHIWNAVYLDNRWLNVDVTWDDPVNIDDETENSLIYDYYLVTADELLKTDNSNFMFDKTIYKEIFN